MDRELESRLLTSAAGMLRRMLVQQTRTSIDAGAASPSRRGPDLLALDAALDELARSHARQARVVELRFFAGLSVERTARVLHVSSRAVEADWRYARAWLNRELARGGAR